MSVGVAPVAAAGEPAAVTADARDQSVSVSWTAPTDVTPASYTVRHRQKDTASWTTSSAISHPTLTYTISGLTNGVEYEIEARTESPGPSEWVSTAAIAGAPQAPAAPVLVSGNKELAVSWTAPADNGSAIVDYELEYATADGMTWTKHYNGGSVSGLGNQQSDTSDPNGNPIDLGEITGLDVTVSREAIGADYGVYKLGAAVDEIWLRNIRLNFESSAVVQARYASTKPTATTLTTHGTQLARSQTRVSPNNPAFVRGYTPSLAANSYIWLVTEAAATVTSSQVELRVDLPTTATSETVTGLVNTTSYQVRTRARNSHGAGAWSPPATLKAGLPAAPAAPTLTSGNTSLDVAWTAPAGHGASITDYDVQYSSDSGASWTEWNASDTGTGTTATITGLTNGTAYQVQVRAQSVRGEGAWSPSATLAPGLPGAPAAPTLSSGNASLGVSWTEPTALHGATVTDYDVQYRACTATDGNGAMLTCATSPTWASTWRSHAHTGTATTATVTGLTNDTAYQVQVRATTANGTGPWSASASASPAAQAPDTPAKPTASASLIWWTPPAANGAAVTNYDLRYSSDSGSTWTEYPGGTGNNAALFIPNKLPGGHSYIVQVRAVNSAGASGWSPSSDSFALPTRKPDKPAAPKLTPKGTSINVSWTAPEDNGSVITDYDVRYALANETMWTEWNAGDDSTTTTASITGLTSIYTYQVQVRASNAIGDGNWSDSANARPDGSAAPDAPAAPTLTKGVRQLTVTWTAPDHNNQAITDYDIQYRACTQSNDLSCATNPAWATTWSSHAHSGTGTSATITGLTNGTAYQVQVRATNSIGTGDWSPAASATLADVPDAPAAPMLEGRNARLHASWTAPNGNGAAVTDYDVQYRACTKSTDLTCSGSNSNSDWAATWTSHAHTGSGTSAAVTGLTDGTGYQVQVRATNAAGDGAWSTSAAAVAGVPLTMDAPVLAGGNTSLTVSWSAPSSDNGSAVTDYDIRYSSDSGTTWTEWNASETSTDTTATITGLTNGAEYLVQVRAANANGDGPWSPGTTATAWPTNVPGYPGSISGSWSTATPPTLDVTWAPPGGSYLEYQVLYQADADTEFDPSPSYPGTGWATPSGDAWVRTPSRSISGLTSTSTYVVTVRALDRATGRHGPWAISGLSEPTGTPGRPSGISETARSGSSLSLRWARVSGSPAVSAYDVRVSTHTSPRSWGTVLTGVAQPGSGTMVSAVVGTGNLPTGFTAAKTYVAQVRAKTGSGTCGSGSTKCSRWVESGPLAQLDVKGLSAAKMERGDDPSYVRSPALDMDMAWDKSPVAGVSYEVAFYYRDGDPDDYYGLADTNTEANSRPDSWRMDWEWWYLCNKHSGSVPTDPLKSRGCGDHTELSRDGYWPPQWWFGKGKWGAWVPLTATQAKCNSDDVCEHIFADVTQDYLTSKVRVRAVKDGTKGPVSEVTSLPPRTPGPPYDLVATAPTGASFELCWNRAFHRGSAIIGFDVQLFDTTAPNTATESVSGTLGTEDPDRRYRFCYTFHGITTAKTYYAKVRAQNGVGYSGWAQSDSVSLTATAPGAPAPPSMSGTGTSVTLTWEAPADNGGSALTGYSVQWRKQNADSTWPSSWTAHTRTGTGTTTTETVGSLTAGAAYQFQVSAVNAIGTGDWSAAALRGTAPVAPAAPTLTSADASLSVAWFAPASPDGGSAVSDYDLRYRSSTDGGTTWSGWTAFAHTGTARSATITGLTNGSLHEVQVRASNATGTSPWSAAAQATPAL